MRTANTFSPIPTPATCRDPNDPACCRGESCCGEGSGDGACC